jgi:hypothetical protein
MSHQAKQITQAVLQALRAAAIAKGSMLTDVEVNAVYDSVPDPEPAPVVSALYVLPVSELLAVESNLRFVAACEKDHAEKISELAEAGANPKRAIRVRIDKTVASGFLELCAAGRRGDEGVFCLPATLQEEMSAHGTE